MEILNEKTINTLKIMADVKEINETIGRKGIEFNFNNSLKANYCKIVEYNVGDKERFIIQLRKKNKDFYGKEQDKLVFEAVIKKEEFNDIFQKNTGIYLNLY